MENLRDMAIGIAIDADSNPFADIRREMATMQRETRGLGKEVTGLGSTFVDSHRGMIDESQAFVKQAGRQSDLIRQLARTSGASATQLAQNWSDMSKEMKQSLIRNHNDMRKYRQQLMGVEGDMWKLGNQMGHYTESTNDFMTEVQRMGKEHKKISEAMINSNVAMRQSLIQQVATITNLSGQSEKIGDVYDQMGSSFLKVNKPLLAVTGGLERLARNGNASVLALKQLGPNASMKALQDRIRLINQGMMRFQMVAVAAAAGSALFYSGLHRAARDSIPGYAEAFDNMMGSLRKAIQPMIELFASIMKPVYGFITSIANMIVTFNEAHPVLAKVIQGFVLLIPALTLILSPLAVGIGLVGGMAAAWSSLWLIIGPVVTGLGAMMGTVLLVSGAIVGLGAAFYLLWTRSDTFRNGVINGWNAIKQTAVNVWGSIKPLIMEAIGAVVSFGQQKMNQLKTFWQENGQQIFQAAKNVWAPIGAVIKTVLGAVWSVMKFVWPAVLLLIKSVWGNIKGVINGGLNIIMGAIKIFSGLFTGDFRKMWEGVKQVFFGAVEFIWNFIQLNMFGKILTAGKAFVLSFRGVAVSLWNGLKNIFLGGINAVKNFTVQGFTFLRSTSDKIFIGLKDSALGIWNMLRGGLSGLITRIINGIKNAWTAARTNTVNMFNNIRDAVTTRFTSIVDGAKALPKRIGDGIKGMAKHAMGGIKHLANTMVSGLAQGVNGVTGGINWVFERIGVDTRIDPWVPPKYAKGTNFHPGGPAIVGDGGGPELMRTPAGQVALSPGKATMVNLPRGTEVLPHRQTASLMNAPAYAGGSRGEGVLASMWGNTKNVASGFVEGIKEAGSTVKDLAVDVFSYLGNPSGLMSKVWDGLGAVFPKMNGAFGEMGIGALKMIKDKAINYVSGLLPSMSSGGIGWGDPFVRTSGFGMRFHPIDQVWKMHNGIDYAAPTGTPIPSQTGGRVSFSGWQNGYGNTVIVDAGAGYQHLYGHNSRNSVSVGQMVSAGSILGLVGSTGKSKGPHVHYEVRKNGKAVNPDSVPAAGGMAPNVSGGAAAWRPMILQAAARMKEAVTPAQVQGIIAQIDRESDGNQRIFQSPQVNDINMRNGNPARGLLQYIPSTFRSYMMPGNTDILNGMHQLLAFFNNTNWRKDLPYGRRGWGPTGARKYANGGIITSPHMGLVGEAGPEAIIPLSIGRRARALKLLAQTAATMGVGLTSGASEYTPSDPYVPKETGSTGGGSRIVHLEYKPGAVTITVPGGGDAPASTKAEFQKMLDDHYKKIQALLLDPEGEMA